MSKTCKLAKAFKRKYPSTVAWRIKKHCEIIDKHINPDEELLYVFVGQKNNSFTNTNIIALTNKRLLFATKRLAFGYFFTAVTPDMFNDITIKQHILWGSILIDTVKEVINITGISKKALDEIETNISEFMMKEKKKYNK